MSDEEFDKFMSELDKEEEPIKKVSWVPWTIFKTGPPRCHICGHRDVYPNCIDKKKCTICNKVTCIFCISIVEPWNCVYCDNLFKE